MNNLLNIFMAIFSTVLIREYYLIFYKEKHNKRKRFILYFLFFIWQIFSMESMSYFPVVIRIVLNIIIVYIVSSNFDGVNNGKIILSLIYDALWMMCEVLVGCIYLGMIHINQYQEMICSIGSKLFLFVLIKFLQHFFHNNIDYELSWKHNVVLMLFPLGSIFIAYHMFLMSNIIGKEKYRITSFMILFVLFILNYAMIYIYRNLSDYYEMKNKKEVYQLEIELLNEHVKEKENTMIQLRKTKHDLKHNLLYAIDLLEHKDYDALSKYLKKVSNLESLEQFAAIHTDNSLVDTIVNYKYVTARKFGITFKMKINIPTTMPFNQPELCVILGNALDNAIEACHRGQVENPTIIFMMNYDGDNLIIIVKNTFDGKIKWNENKKVITRKENREEHGIGLSSIKKSLEVFHGYYETEIKENMYCLKMILFSPEIKERD